MRENEEKSGNGKNEKKEIPGVVLLLNGGKKEMDAATIPIRWFFSEEVIAKNPKHLVFFEQNEFESKRYHVANYGRRYACKVSDGVGFLQLFSPGYHRIMVLALKEGDGKDNKAIERLLKDVSLSWGDAENGKLVEEYGCRFDILAAAVAEFFVPKELFAKEPETFFQKAVWEWANLWHRSGPRDECDYRKRKIIAFTVKLVPGSFWLIWYLLTRFFGAIYLAFASGAILFAGFRPKPLGKNLRDFILMRQEFESDVLRYSISEVPGFSRYKIWSSLRDKGYVVKRIPFAPWEVCVLIALAVSLYKFRLLVGVIGLILAQVVVVVIFCMALICLGGYLKKACVWIASQLPGKSAEEIARLEEERMKKERKADAQREKRLAEKRKLSAEREKEYQQWLAANFDLGKNRGKVILSDLPVPLAKKERAVQFFRVSFWALKAKVCRPYSR